MAFLDVLDRDVISRILCQCNIPEVLSISQTCSYLHTMAFSKTVWLALTTSVHRRINLDVPEGESFESLSMEALIDLVKRAVHGPRSWSPSFPKVPEIRRRNVLDIPNNHSDAPKLLAGGKYLLLRRQEGLACWQVPISRRIWEYVPHGIGDQPNARFRVHRVAEEVIQGGTAVMLMICLETILTDHNQLTIEFVRLNLLTGHSELLHSAVLLKRPFAFEFFHPRIRGDKAAVGLRFGSAILIIDWRTGQQTELPVQSVYDLELIPGYLYVIEGRQDSSICILNMWSTDDIEHLPTSIQTVLTSPAYRDLIPLRSSRPPLQALLSVKPHPLYDNTYVLWAFVTSAIPNFTVGLPVSSLYANYTIWLPPNQGFIMGTPKLHHIDKGFASIGWSGTSFGGHIMIYTPVLQGQRNVILRMEDIAKYADNAEDLAAFPRAQQITPYSGGLVYLGPMQDTLVIEYYE